MNDCRACTGQPTHLCVAGPACRDKQRTDHGTTPATTEHPETLCPACLRTTEWAINDTPNLWGRLHAAIGEKTANTTNGRVSGSRNPPILINPDIDAAKTSLVEWICCAAARISDILGTDAPWPQTHTDRAARSALHRAVKLLAPHSEHLTRLPEAPVAIWDPQAARPGEHTRINPGRSIVDMTGAQIALKIIETHAHARKLLGLTETTEVLPLPCPGCDEKQLIRHHTIKYSTGGNKPPDNKDRVKCRNCGLDWEHDRYQQLIRIWLREEEMRSEELAKKLQTEQMRGELTQWLLAKKTWQLNTIVETIPDLADLVADEPTNPQLMTDRDLAALLGINDSTIRQWASRGHITRHTNNDGSTRYDAEEVWNCHQTRTKTGAA